MPLFKRSLGRNGTDSSKGQPATAASSSSGTAKRDSGSQGKVSIEPQALMKIRSLELRAKSVVDGFLSGIHRSPWHGFSVEFTDYRQYSPGDDVRYLDWKLYARQDRFYIKRFEDETNLRCYLVADLSQSMGFGTVGYSKADYARTALATLACFLSMQRDAVGLLTFDETLGDYLPPRYRPGYIRRVMLGLERATAGKRTEIAPPLQQVTRLARKRGLVVLASDLLAPVADLKRELGYLRSQGHDVVVMRILDPAEIEFTFQDPQIFEDLESGKRLFVDPDAIRKTYLNNFQKHASDLQEACQEEGVQLMTWSTDQPLDEVLLEFVRIRGGKRGFGRNANRSRQGGAA